MNLNDLKPGQSVVYFRGPCIAKAITHLKVKQTAWEMYMRDEAVLTQRMLPLKRGSFINDYEYIITRRHGAPRPEELKKRQNFRNRLLNKGK